MLRVTSRCSRLTALTLPADRSASAVMLNCGPAPLSYAPEREETIAIGAEGSPAAGQVFLDEVELERVVSGRDRRVRREDRASPDFLERVVEARTALGELPDALQDDERRVSFVEVKDVRVESRGS